MLKAVVAEMVEAEEESELPEEREEPEKETLRMLRSRGRVLDRLHFWLKLWPSICMMADVCV